MSGARDPIGGWMRGAPVSIAEKLTLRRMAAVLSQEDIGAALVERADGPLGIVSSRMCSVFLRRTCSKLGEE